jgi:hypothetical protein
VVQRWLLQQLVQPTQAVAAVLQAVMELALALAKTAVLEL